MIKKKGRSPEKHSFWDEYLLLLEKFEIEYDAKNLFEWYEQDN